MGQIPSSHKGKLKECAICGFWYGEREMKLFKQRGIWIDKACYDELTEDQRSKNTRR